VPSCASSFIFDKFERERARVRLRLVSIIAFWAMGGAQEVPGVCAEFNPLPRGRRLAIAARLRQDADEPTLKNALRGSGQAGWGTHKTENSAAVIFSALGLRRGAESAQTKGK
jgi:hypothetical protein